MRLGHLCRRMALALGLLAAAAAPGFAAGIAQPPPGTKNFATPPAVPNYFTDESGPFHTRASAHAASLGDEPRFTRPEPAEPAAIAPTRYRSARLRHAAAHYRHRAGPHHRASLRRTAYRSTTHPRAGGRLASNRSRAAHLADRAAPSRGAAPHHAVAATAHRQPTARHHHGGGARG